jgi:hypothetical protein
VATSRVGRIQCGHIWIGVRLGVWLFTLPLRLRRYSLPGLLEHLTPGQGQRLWSHPQEMERIVRLVSPSPR